MEMSVPLVSYTQSQQAAIEFLKQNTPCAKCGFQINSRKVVVILNYNVTCNRSYHYNCFNTAERIDTCVGCKKLFTTPDHQNDYHEIHVIERDSSLTNVVKIDSSQKGVYSEISGDRQFHAYRTASDDEMVCCCKRRYWKIAGGWCTFLFAAGLITLVYFGLFGPKPENR